MTKEKINLKTFRPALVLLNVFIVLTASEMIVSPESKETVHTHCLSSGEDLVFSNPFPTLYSNREGFLWLELKWTFKKYNAQIWTVLIFENQRDKTEEEPRATFLDGWGLRVSNITLEDSGTYKARLVKHSGNIEKKVIVTVAYPPTLNSTVLSVTKNSIKNVGNGATFSCGTFGSFGQPAIYPKWILKDGSTFNSTSQVGGDVFLELPGPVDELQELECVLDFEAPAAHCIPESERNRWSAWFWPPTETPDTNTTEKPDTNNIILVVGIAVGVAVLIGITVVIFYFVKKHKEGKSIKEVEQEQLKRDEVVVPQEDEEDAKEEDAKDQAQNTDPSDESAVEGFGTKVN